MSHKKSYKKIKKRKNAFFFFKFCCKIQIHRIDLPSKKMTRCTALIITLAVSTLSFGQNYLSIGTDLAETAYNGNMRIIISHAFSQMWSSEASASFRIGNDLWHNRTFSGNGYSEWEMSFRYWAQDKHKGASVALGIVSGFKQIPDLKINVAYTIPLWKGIHINIGYGLRMMQSIKGIKPGTQDIAIEIHYRL